MQYHYLHDGCGVGACYTDCGAFRDCYIIFWNIKTGFSAKFLSKIFVKLAKIDMDPRYLYENDRNASLFKF